jgi:hypothetical protein
MVTKPVLGNSELITSLKINELLKVIMHVWIIQISLKPKKAEE